MRTPKAEPSTGWLLRQAFQGRLTQRARGAPIASLASSLRSEEVPRAESCTVAWGLSRRRNDHNLHQGWRKALVTPPANALVARCAFPPAMVEGGPTASIRRWRGVKRNASPVRARIWLGNTVILLSKWPTV
jgi:hypothetical protein